MVTQDTADLVAELQELARQGDVLSAGTAPLPLLRGLATRWRGHEAGLDDVHALIAAGADRLDASQRAAALEVFGDHEHRFLHNLMARRTRAGELLGLGESNFRKKRDDGKSPYDQLTAALAEAIEAVGGPAATENAASRRPSSPDRRRLATAAVAALVLVVGVAVTAVALDSAGDGEKGALEAEDLDAGPTATTTLSKTASPTATVAGIAQVGRPVEGCDIPIGATVGADSPPPEVVDAAANAYESAAASTELGCPRAVMKRWQALWVQEVGAPETATWHITVEDGAPEWAFVLSDLLFRGYFRILDDKQGEGVNAQTRAGLPREVENRPTAPLMRTSNGSLVIGQSDQVMPRWMPAEAVAIWEELGGAESGLGYPVTDLNFLSNTPHQEFEYGYGQAVDGHVEATVLDPADIANEVAALPRRTEMIVETFDKTSWWIDAEGVRHWIASEEAWECLGGTAAKVGEYTPGWVLGTFPLGDIAVCG